MKFEQRTIEFRGDYIRIVELGEMMVFGHVGITLVDDQSDQSGDYHPPMSEIELPTDSDQ